MDISLEQIGWVMAGVGVFILLQLLVAANAKLLCKFNNAFMDTFRFLPNEDKSKGHWDPDTLKFQSRGLVLLGIFVEVFLGIAALARLAGI